MISYEHGRWRSVRTNTEKLNAALEAVRQLTVDERAALGIVLGEFEDTGTSQTADEAAEFEWEETPLPIEEWILSEYHVGETGKDLYPILRKDICELFHAGALKKGGYAEAVLCLHPDTRVPLLDGTAPTIAELAERWQRDSVPFWVYSYVNGELGRAQAVQPRQTGVDDYYQVTLDDGSTFIGNSRHQMLRRTGEKVMIRDMRPGDSLMPFEVKFSSTSAGDDLDGYEKTQLLSGEWAYTHRLVAKALCEQESERHSVVHHEDLDKRNNTPENLTWMKWLDHFRLHHQERRVDITIDAIRATGAASLQEAAEALECSYSRIRYVLQKNGYTQTEFFGNRRGRRRGKDDLTMAAVRLVIEGGARTAREAAKHLDRDRSTLHRFLRARGTTWTKLLRGHDKKLTVERVVAAIQSGAATVTAAAHSLGCYKSTIYKLLNREGLEWAELGGVVGNHFVVSVEKIGRGPVYCLSVPGAGNFAISTQHSEEEEVSPIHRSGVFSSNTGAIGWG